MPDILDDLRADLDASFARAERKRSRRRWTVGAATAALSSLAAVVVLTTSSTSPATAAEALRAVARVAQSAPAAMPRDDQFFYVRSRVTAGLSMYAGVDPEHEWAATLVASERQIWVSVDRPGRLIDKVTGKRPLTPADAHRKQGPEPPGGDGRPMRVGATRHYLMGGERLSRAELLAYPTDPQAVYDRIRAHIHGDGRSRELHAFDAIATALRERPAPPALRAALYRALALVPGIELVGPDTVAVTVFGTRHELIFSPDTAELQAERRVLVDPAQAEIDAPPGTVVGEVAYLERAVVDELP